MVPDTYPGTEGNLKMKGLWDLYVRDEGTGSSPWEIDMPPVSTTSLTQR